MRLPLRSPGPSAWTFHPPLRRCLGLVARHTDRLQVDVLVGSAHGLADDVVNVLGLRHTTSSKAWLTQAAVPLEDCLALSIPCAAIATLMPGAARSVCKLPSVLVILVEFAEPRSVTRQPRAARMPAWSGWSCWHRSHRIKRPPTGWLSRESPCHKAQEEDMGQQKSPVAFAFPGFGDTFQAYLISAFWREKITSQDFFYHGTRPASCSRASTMSMPRSSISLSTRRMQRQRSVIVLGWMPTISDRSFRCTRLP